jgi:DNA-directed RNA polymerase sigma subunit (sigma70/sigma32)
MMSETSQVMDLESLIVLLPTVEQRVIRLAFGYETGGPWTDQEISEAIGVPRSTINWLKRKALRTLEAQMKGL